MMIFTSNFARYFDLKKAQIEPIGIARYAPRSKGPMQHYYALAPSAKTFLIQDEKAYTIAFCQQLAQLDAYAVLEDLHKLTGGATAALLCYERPGTFCHRHLVSQWILESTGVLIEEWVPPAKTAPNHGQLSIF